MTSIATFAPTIYGCIISVLASVEYKIQFHEIFHKALFSISMLEFDCEFRISFGPIAHLPFEKLLIDNNEYLCKWVTLSLFAFFIMHTDWGFCISRA